MGILHIQLMFAGIETDSVEVVPVWTINDSLINIPAYDEYCGFNQKSIWGEKIDLTKSSDTMHFELVHDSCDFHAPIVGRLTSSYGWRHNRPHYGVDVKCITGDTILNVFDGMVRISRYSSTYGHVVVVRHQNGLETLYAHLSKRSVTEGDFVEAGSLVGLGGNTGRSFGSHLHFEVRYLGEPIDPLDIFEISDSSFALKDSAFDLSAGNLAFLKDVRKIKYHRVRSGDSLWRISKNYGVSINELCALNGISRKKTLSVGQMIRYN